ncbi:MAG: uridine diphosphate-N-acetylglucosamine-binding protein YvcK, partial [Anaerolineaceae bacterium]|nr:uridine diphosphate-N-acetylglucosamine-binding protein YvcK [Anaerolineaceae bacterium]
MSNNKYNLKRKLSTFLSVFIRWLTPGIGIKRWLVVVLIGITFIALGITFFILDIYRSVSLGWLRSFLVAISLSSFPRWLRAVIYGGIGGAILILGIVELNKSVLKPFLKPGQPLLETISNYRRREKGPRIVAIGGGTGLSSLLRGLKKYSHNLTAIVTVADDGGSSGELRKNLGILPPGDIRHCLTALADDEEMLSHVFQYRFGKRAGINGHSLGNLFISALADITGSFEEAVAESGRVLAVKGRVLPATLHDVKLVAEINLPDEEREVKVVGESTITKINGEIERVWLEPSNPLPFPPSVQAILSADLIVIGPGSLYTSVIPNLLVPGLADALRSSKALKFFVCNVANQKGETTGYTWSDHIHAVEKHLEDIHFDVILCNDSSAIQMPGEVEAVIPDKELEDQYSVYFASIADPNNAWRHDPDKLAEIITDLFHERTGPLVN